MARTYFEDLPSTNTPLSAERLNGLLNGEESIEKLVVGDIECKNLLPRLIKGIGLNTANGSEVSSSTNATSTFVEVNFNENPNYYLSGLVSTLHSYVAAYNSSKQFLGRTGGSRNSNILLSDSVFTDGTPQGTGDIAYLRVTQYFTTGDSGSIDDIDNAPIQLENGTEATDYVPFKKYGYNSVDSMGSIVVDDIECKNLATFNSAPGTVGGVTMIPNTNASLILNGTSTTEILRNNEFYKRNLSFTLDAGTYTFSEKNSYNELTIYLRKSLDDSDIAVLGSTFTLSETTKVYIGIYIYQKTFNNLKLEFQVEKGTQKTNYVEHKSFDNDMKLLYNSILTSSSGSMECDLSENGMYLILVHTNSSNALRFDIVMKYDSQFFYTTIHTSSYVTLTYNTSTYKVTATVQYTNLLKIIKL